MANFPQIVVEIALDDGPFVANPTWTDISEWCSDLSVSRGRKRFGDLFGASTFEIQVDNSDRRFDPSYEAGPWFGLLRPNRQIRVRAVWPLVGGTTYPVIRGLIDSLPLEWNKELGRSTITATDWFKALEREPLSGSPYTVAVLTDAPAGLWAMTETSNEQRAADESGNDRHGRYIGSPTFELPDPIEDGGANAVDFGTWTSGLKGILHLGKLDFGANPFAVEFWFRRRPIVSADTAGFFFVAAVGSQPLVAVFIDTAPLNGIISFFVEPLDFLDGPKLDDNQWHHVVAQRLAGGTMEIWVDGALAVSASSANTAVGPTPTSIGGLVGAAESAGLMAYPAFYSAPLSAGAIAAHYEARGGWALDAPGQRVNRLLDIAGVPESLRSVDAGYGKLTGVPELSGSVLDALQTATESEYGSLVILRDGTVRFRGRHALLGLPYTASRATFSDEQAEGDWHAESWDPDDWEIGPVRYSAPVVDYDEATIRNAITLQRDGGAPQVLIDQTSVAKYGERRWSKTGLVNADDFQVADIAFLVRKRHAEPRLEFTSIQLQPFADPSLWPVVLGLELEDRVTMRATPSDVGAQLDLSMFVQGIRHQVTSEPLDWVTTLDLALAEDIPAYGRLDINQLDLDFVLAG